MAGAALLIGYILTVAVSVAAGSAAIASTIAALEPWRVPLSLFFIALIAYGNLRGVRESGKLFAAPTYFFMVNMALLIGWGIVPSRTGGDLPVLGTFEEGMVELGDHSGLMTAASAFVMAKAFASGGSRSPAWRPSPTACPPSTSRVAQRPPDAGDHGQRAGRDVPGPVVPGLQDRGHPVRAGTPTVLAQIGEVVYGHGAAGEALSNVLNVATMLILVLAANTGFADFPRLANLQAGDSFLPRQLTKRGHRLVFSNGIIALAAAAAVLVVVSNAPSPG